MKWSKWLENWDMTSLKSKAPFLEMEWSDSDFLSSPRRVTSGRRDFKCVLGPVFGVQTKTK